MAGRFPTMRDVFRELPHIGDLLLVCLAFLRFCVNAGDLVIDYAPTKIHATEEVLSQMEQPNPEWNDTAPALRGVPP